MSSGDSTYDVDDLFGEEACSASDNAIGNSAETFGLENDTGMSSRQHHYTILSEAEVARLQEDSITKISNLLSISRAHSCILLCHYNWNSGSDMLQEMLQEWFADQDRIRNATGLLEKNPVETPNEEEIITCTICLETHRHRSTSAAACGHRFCDSCWRSYIAASVGDGATCLMMRCPHPSCGAAVDQDMVDRLASDEDKAKYHRFLLRSYIEQRRNTKWCPAPGCEFAVELETDGGCYDVCCRCTFQFCWNCCEEAHRPVDCVTVSKWMLKNKDESENTNWILAHSKPCPKCKRPIEKNNGCMHMTCSAPCWFQFCWLCLDPWLTHASCNRYSRGGRKGFSEEEERRRKIAKMHVDKYSHYYERWAANHSSRQKALAYLKGMVTARMKQLIESQQTETEMQLHFVVEAWEQIAECRRVLKWTYAYGYFLLEEEQAKKRFFEYLQGEAEAGLERLHKCAEQELEDFVGNIRPCDDFRAFRSKLVDLTRVTKTYFENLVRALENGLQDVQQKNGSTSRTR